MIDMLNAFPMSKKDSFGLVNKIDKNGDLISFEGILAQINGHEESNNSLLEAMLNSEEFQFSSEIEKLMELLDGLDFKDDLLLDDLKEVIEIFPDQFLDEILQLFIEDPNKVSEIDLDTLSNDPLNLLTLLIHLTALENKNSFIGQSESLHQNLLKQFETVFPRLMSETENKSFRHLTEQLSNHLKQLTQSKEMLEGSNLRELMRLVSASLNEKKVVEKAFSNVSQLENKIPPIGISSFDSNNNHMSRVQQFMFHNGVQGDRVSEEQFIRQIQNILNRSQFQQLSNGIQQLSIKLHPQSLGRLDINIQQVNGVLVAKMMTTTQVARELIEGQIQQLRSAFQAQNIQVDRIEITQQQAHQSSQNPFKDNDEEKRESQRDANEQDDSQNTEEDESFQEFLQDLIDMKV